jgi:hypothetical protein
MEEIVARISKGSKMDQIYIPKNRISLENGAFVIIRPLSEQIKKRENVKKETPYFYRIKKIEPVKMRIINEIFSIIEGNVKSYDNIIITGSILEMGFKFNDIDIIILSEEKINENILKEKIELKTGIITHIIYLSKKALQQGLEIDPLYQSMLSKCVSKKRFFFRLKRKIEYKILDLHLLKSEPIIHSFDILNGEQKYHFARNLIAIKLFLENKKVDNEDINKEIIKLFGLKDINEIKDNLLEKKKFLHKYENLYKQLSNTILRNIKNGSKQK